MTAASITLRDGLAYLSVSEPDLWEAIIDATSYLPQGIEYAVPSSRADKRMKLVRNQKCPVGLLDRVCRVMREHEVQPVLTNADSRAAPKPRLALRLREVRLRPYQEQAGMAALINDRGIFRAPTGAGKTVIGGQILVTRGLHAVVIVPTIDLLYQFKGWLDEHLVWSTPQQGRGESVDVAGRVGQLGDGVVDPQPVTVATIRTIAKVLDVAYETYEYAEYDDTDNTEVNRKALRGWVERLGVVLVDEAHILGAKTVYEVTTGIPAPCKYGMSASPWRDDGADLMIEAATGPPIYRISAKELVQGGWLMAPEIVVKDTSGWWQSAAWGSVCVKCGRQASHKSRTCACGGTKYRSQYTEAYRTEIVDNNVRNARIAQDVTDIACPTLVLVKQVKHGRNLQALLPGSVFLSGRDKGRNREQLFERMRQGEVQTVICTQIGDMGLDLPILAALVLAGGGKSSTRHLQRVGRVVRPYPGKQTPLVIDYDDSHIHSWYSHHARARRRIEHAEWGEVATWISE